MTKTNAQTATAEKVSKRVLTEQDLLPVGAETQAQLKKRYAKELAMLAESENCPRAATIVAKQGMARGLSSRDAPHSAKSLYDTRRHESGSGSGKADARQARLAREADKKAERAKRAAPKADDNRKIKVVLKDYQFGREGTARNLSWQACKQAKTVAAYAAAGGALKYLPRWVAAGAITLG